MKENGRKGAYQLFSSGYSTIRSRSLGNQIMNNIPLLISHEPYIGKLLNIFAGYNVFNLPRQLEHVTPSKLVNNDPIWLMTNLHTGDFFRKTHLCTVLAKTLVMFFVSHCRVKILYPAMTSSTAGYKFCVRQFTSYLGCHILTTFCPFFHPDRIVQRCDWREKLLWPIPNRTSLET